MTKKCKKCGSANIVIDHGGRTLRTSCFECVEKHVFSAWKLLCEIQDGYDFRRMVLGELIQAEEESLAWNELHDYLRLSRKQYQIDNILPDWHILDELMQEIYFSMIDNLDDE